MTEPMGERGRQGAAPLGEHTPGPWEIVTDPAAGAWFRVRIPIRRQVYNESFITHREADARLIAAAPELLALVEKWLEIGIQREEGFAVIAKARGEQ